MGFISVPCKNVYVSPQKLNQFFLLLWGQPSSNLEESLKVVPYNYLFQAFTIHLVIWPLAL